MCAACTLPVVETEDGVLVDGVRCSSRGCRAVMHKWCVLSWLKLFPSEEAAKAVSNDYFSKPGGANDILCR